MVVVAWKQASTGVEDWRIGPDSSRKIPIFLFLENVTEPSKKGCACFGLRAPHGCQKRHFAVPLALESY